MLRTRLPRTTDENNAIDARFLIPGASGSGINYSPAYSAGTASYATAVKEPVWYTFGIQPSSEDVSSFSAVSFISSPNSIVSLFSISAETAFILFEVTIILLHIKISIRVKKKKVIVHSIFMSSME